MQPTRRIRPAIRALAVVATGLFTSVCSGGGTDEASAPQIQLSSSSQNFAAVEGGGNPPSQVVGITNGGGGTLSGLEVGTVTYGAGATGWLEPPVLGSTTADPSATLTLQPVTDGLAAGTYAATVPMISDVASNSPQNVSVTLTVSSQDCGATAYTIGATVNGALSPGDCGFGDGSFYDAYAFGATATASVRVDLASTTFDTFLLLTDAAGNILAFNDDGPGTTNSTFRILLGTSSYLIDANSLLAGISGNYTLSSSVVATDVTGCEEVWVTPGITTTQAIATSDCVDTPGPFYHDEYVLRIRSGQGMTVTQSSTGFDPYLFLVRLDTNGSFVVSTASGPDATFGYTNNETSAYYVIVAATDLAGKTGGYTLSIVPRAGAIRTTAGGKVPMDSAARRLDVAGIKQLGSGRRFDELARAVSAGSGRTAGGGPR
jgi:hypothetical protein